MHFARIAAAALVAVGMAGAPAGAQVLNSPAGGTLPAGVTPVGGLVADLIGLNGNRVVSQLAASTLYVGFANDGQPISGRGNPVIIGTQTGFTPSIISALGGGLSQAAFRVSLFDGDTGAGDFDFNQNFFQVNGTEIGNFSSVATVQTTSTGTFIANSFGFNDNRLLSGFFFTNNAGFLSSIYASLLSTGNLVYGLRDIDPNDNFYDFTQGIDGGLINIGQGPIVTPGPGTTVPEPSTYALMAVGLAGLAAGARRRDSGAQGGSVRERLSP